MAVQAKRIIVPDHPVFSNSRWNRITRAHAVDLRNVISMIGGEFTVCPL